MIRRRFGNIILAPNDLLIRQKADTQIEYGENQSVIDWVKSNVHRYHAKMKDGILYATQLDDNNSAKYLDGQTALVSDVSMGDTLVYIPQFYATLLLEQGDTSVYRFSREAINDDSFAFGDVFIGAYGGDYTNGTLNSISHPGSTTGTYKTKEQLESMAASKGSGYSPATLEEHNLVGLLYVAIHHNTDCKGTLGSGSNTYDRPCGTTTSVGMKESEPGDVYTSFLGLENWWGGRYEIVGKIVANDGAVNGIYKVTGRDGSVREIQSIAPTSQWLYPRKMILGKRFDIVADPICYAGEITSGHGWNSEQYMRNEADRVVIRGGFQADISSGFAFLAARFTNTESGTYNTMTGRLAYKGNYEFIDTDSYREKFDPNYVPPVVSEEYDVNDAPDGAYVYTSDNKLMNLAAYQQSGKTLDDVWGIAVLDGDHRFCIDPRIKDRLQINVDKPVVVPNLKAYESNDTGIGLYTSWYIGNFEDWYPDKAPAFWFALKSIFKHGEHGYLPSYGEAQSMQKYQDGIADIINSIGFESPIPLYHTSTFPSSLNQNYINVMYGGFDNGISMGSTSFTTVCTSLPISMLMETKKDYFTFYQIDRDLNQETSISTTKHGVTDSIFENSHRYLCKYIDGVMNICQLDDANSNLFHDGTPADLTGSQGDVMVMIPKFYSYNREIALNFLPFCGSIQTEYDENLIEYGGDLIGAYQSSLINGELRSVSGHTVASGMSKNQFYSYATQRGAGFHLLKHEHMEEIALLFLLKYSSFEWWNIIGNGNYSDSHAPGSTNNMGMSDGSTQDGNVNFIGIEDFWGNGYEYIENATYGDKKVWSSSPMYHVDWDNGKTMGVEPEADKNILLNCSNIITHNERIVNSVKACRITMFPSHISEEPKGLRAQIVLSDQFDRAVARGGCNDGLGNGYGLVYINTMFGVDEAGDAKNRSRISYKGDINVIENVQEFLSL